MKHIKNLYRRNRGRRITGASTPWGGASWTPETEKDFMRNLVVALENRRFLFDPLPEENRSWVVKSVLEVRKELTDTRKNLQNDSEADRTVKALVIACQDFLTRTPRNMSGFNEALTKLRGVFVVELQKICDVYKVKSDIVEKIQRSTPFDHKM